MICLKLNVVKADLVLLARTNCKEIRMKRKKILGIPKIDLPQLHIIIVSVIFILIFPVTAIIASYLANNNAEVKVEMSVNQVEEAIQQPKCVCE